MLVATMDVSSLKNPFSEYISSLHNHKKPYDDHNQLTHSEKNTSNNEAAEFEKSHCDILHVQDDPELVSNGIPVIYHPEKTNICEESKLNLVNSPTSTTQKRLSKSATFPCSKVELLDLPFTEGMHEPHTMKSENAACTRSKSLPTPSKLVSALKGSRENQGIPPKKLSLKWAPEVYDPPVTSLSHTVKGHSHHRSRSAKKTTKHKHKGKSSHSSSSSSSSSSDKKQYRKYTGKSESRSKTLATRDKLQSCDSKPRETRDRLQFGDSKTQETRETLLIRDFNKSTIELLDFAVGGQDTKCGSSYLRTSLATLHLSVAEAT